MQPQQRILPLFYSQFSVCENDLINIMIILSFCGGSFDTFSTLGGEISCAVVMTSPTWRIRLVVQHCHIMLYNTVWYTALGVGCFHWRVGPNPPSTQLGDVLFAVARKPPHQWL